MILAVSFWLLLLSITVLAWIIGDVAERGFAVVLNGAALATLALQWSGSWYAMRLGFVVTDGLVLMVALVLALRSDRYWPIWFSGFQSVSILVTIASAIVPTNRPSLYGELGSFWAIPALIAMAAGMVIDDRLGWRRPGSVA